MKKNRLIFYSIFAAYQLVVFILTVYVKVNQGDIGSLLSLLTNISLFMYGSLIGVILLLADFIWAWKSGRETEKLEAAMRLENNTLKAKIYDLQEGVKSPSSVPPSAR